MVPSYFIDKIYLYDDGHLSVSAGISFLCLQIRTYNGRFSGLWVQDCRQCRLAPAISDKCRADDRRNPAMVGSLSTFCTRQLVGRRLADACQHVVEELATERLPAVARGVGASGTIAKFTLHVPEEGEKALLEVDCHDLVACGADPSQLAHGSDAISDAVIAGYSVLTTPTGDAANDPAVICYEIG